MRPLQSNQRMLIWLCAYSTEGTDDKHRNSAHVAFTAVVFATYVCFLGASIAYWLKFATVDLSETLYATIQITAALPMIKALIIMIFLRHKFKALFESLAKIYDASKWHCWWFFFNPKSKFYLIEFRFRCRRWCVLTLGRN